MQVKTRELSTRVGSRNPSIRSTRRKTGGSSDIDYKQFEVDSGRLNRTDQLSRFQYTSNEHSQGLGSDCTSEKKPQSTVRRGPKRKRETKQRVDPRVRKMIKRIDEVEKTPMENLDMVLMDHATNAKYDFTEFNDLLESEAFLKSYEMDALHKGTRMVPKVTENGCFFAYERIKPLKKPSNHLPGAFDKKESYMAVYPFLKNLPRSTSKKVSALNDEKAPVKEPVDSPSRRKGQY